MYFSLTVRRNPPPILALGLLLVSGCLMAAIPLPPIPILAGRVLPPRIIIVFLASFLARNRSKYSRIVARSQIRRWIAMSPIMAFGRLVFPRQDAYNKELRGENPAVKQGLKLVAGGGI